MQLPLKSNFITQLTFIYYWMTAINNRKKNCKRFIMPIITNHAIAIIFSKWWKSFGKSWKCPSMIHLNICYKIITWKTNLELQTLCYFFPQYQSHDCILNSIQIEMSYTFPHLPRVNGNFSMPITGSNIKHIDCLQLYRGCNNSLLVSYYM